MKIRSSTSVIPIPPNQSVELWGRYDFLGAIHVRYPRTFLSPSSQSQLIHRALMSFRANVLFTQQPPWEE